MGALKVSFYLEGFRPKNYHEAGEGAHLSLLPASPLPPTPPRHKELRIKIFGSSHKEESWGDTVKVWIHSALIRTFSQGTGDYSFFFFFIWLQIQISSKEHSDEMQTPKQEIHSSVVSYLIVNATIKESLLLGYDSVPNHQFVLINRAPVPAISGILYGSVSLFCFLTSCMK